MIEYAILAGSAGIFLLVLIAVAGLVLLRTLRPGSTPVSSALGAVAARVEQRAHDFESLVAEYAARIEADAKAAALKTKISAMVADPKPADPKAGP